MEIAKQEERKIGPLPINDLTKFLFKAAVIYLLWEIMNSHMRRYPWFLEIWNGIHDGILLNVLQSSELILRMLRDDISRRGILISIGNSPGVAVGPGCVALGLLYAFAGLIISYSGPWKSKMWFIPLGLLLIHFFNAVRVISLAYLSYYNNRVVDFNHKYVFNTVIYIVIFILWVSWVRYVEHLEKKAEQKA